MTAMFVAVPILIAFIVFYILEFGARVKFRQGKASLAKNLPPDVQAEMKPNLLNLMTVLAFAVVVFLMIKVDLVTGTRLGTDLLVVGFGLVATVVLAARIAWIARARLDRGYLGEVRGDLSPYSLAGAIRLRAWALSLLSVVYFLGIFALISLHLTGFQRTGGWLFLAVWTAVALLISGTYVKYVDRIWLAERGLCFGVRLYPWDGFERVAWSKDGRAVALRRRGLWRQQRWTVVPVPEGSRQAAEETLRQVMLAPAPTL